MSPTNQRVDYYYDPNAPKATSRKPSASVLVRDDAGRLLLIQRTDNNLWTIPTGGLKKNETIPECGVRECREETGVDIAVIGLVGVFSDPNHRIAYADGEVRQPVNICLRARPTGGQATATDEASQVRWVDPADLDDYEIHPAIRARITHGLTYTEPHIG